MEYSKLNKREIESHLSECWKFIEKYEYLSESYIIVSFNLVFIINNFNNYETEKTFLIVQKFMITMF